MNTRIHAHKNTRTHTRARQAEEAAKKGPECALKNRLLFHVSHKLLDENKLMTYHQKLSDTNEDQLSLAAIHYLRSHFQEVGGGEFLGQETLAVYAAGLFPS